MSWLKRLFSSSDEVATRRTTFADPLVIASPRLGIWNLLGPAAGAAVEEDRAALAPLFATTTESSDVPPPCDVLLVYCSVGRDGRIAGSANTLRDVIWKAQACITVVATENAPESYIAASKLPGRGRANLVMTVVRNGGAFPTFFSRLFGAMKLGKTMPVAWVELAPQIPGRDQPECPGTIFACEAGHIAFG